MGIKVTINKREEPENPKYPCLKVSGDIVVLFTERYTGTVVVGWSCFSTIGKYSDTWIEKNFKPLQGSVTLEND